MIRFRKHDTYFVKIQSIIIKNFIYYLQVEMQTIKDKTFYKKKPIFLHESHTPHTPHTPFQLLQAKKYPTQEIPTDLPEILQFQDDQYPFVNKYQTNSKIYKTQLAITQDTSQIKDRITKIKHPNIICAKEVKEREQITAHGRKHCLLDITYQEVPFSIKFVGFAQQDSSFLFKKIAESNFREILNKITIYLMKMEIKRAIRLTDIGVTEQGVIKVFFPPAISKDRGPIPQHIVFSNNYKLVSWWETTFNKQVKQIRQSPFNNPKGNEIIEASKIKLSCNSLQRLDRESKVFIQNKLLGDLHNRQIQSKDSQEELRLQANKRNEIKIDGLEKCLEASGRQNPNLKSSSKSYQSQISKMANFQAQKMKKIDKQIKLIEQKMEKRSKKKIEKCKQSNQFIQKNLQIIHKALPNVKLAQSQRRQNNAGQTLNKMPQQVVFRDSIQQNINCINIYHTPSPNTHQIFAKKNQNFQEPPNYLDRLQDIPDQDSLDTYDIQFANQESVVNFPLKIIGPTEKQDREISERTYKVKKEELRESRSKKNNQKNQVQSRKFETESAGPLQFKNFVNNFIKPQFLAKESNIYEDPMEEDSQQEFPQKVHYSKLAQAELSVASKTHESHSIKKEKKKELQMTRKDEISLKTTQEIQRVRSDNKLDIVPFLNAKKEEEAVINEQQLGQKQLVNRVQDILTKTKRAIAVLNRMKQGNRNLIRKALSP